MARSSVSLPGSEATFSRYLRKIRKFPMLSQEDEYVLATCWKERREAAAVQKLATSHLRLVARIAIGYSGYGLPLSDLVSEGNVGLMQAINRFDPERGFRLATYAAWWIRAAMQQYILQSWSLVKMGTTVSQKKLFFNLRKLKSQLRAIDDGHLSPEHVKRIADELDVAESDVISMNGRLSGPDQSLNAPQRADGGGEWQERIADERENQETQLGEREELRRRRHLLSDAMTNLRDREKRVLIERHLRENPQTLRELSEKYGISPERVRQIEQRAFYKLRRTIKSRRVERGTTAHPSDSGAVSRGSEEAHRQLTTYDRSVPPAEVPVVSALN
jgi:RNA polymerase sigma-32 factor